MKQNNRDTKYILFKNSNLKMRLSMLHLNSMNKSQVKYEFLQSCSVYDEVEYKGKVGLLKQILMNVKDGEDRLFTVVE